MLALTPAARSHPAETHSLYTYSSLPPEARLAEGGNTRTTIPKLPKKSGAWGRVAGRSRVRSHLSGTDSHRTRVNTFASKECLGRRAWPAFGQVGRAKTRSRSRVGSVMRRFRARGMDPIVPNARSSAPLLASRPPK